MSTPRDPAALRLRALWELRPEEAAAKVRAACAQTDSLDDAAALLHVSPRTLYRWLSFPELQTAPREPMKPRDLRGAIRRAKTVYVLCQYNPTQTFFTKVSKEAARELADAAKDDAGAPEDIVASEDAGDLYIGHLPSDATPCETEEETSDDDE